MENKRPNEQDTIAGEERISEPNWSEQVEDLVAAGDVTAAISFLESLATNLQSRFGSSSSGERTEFGRQLAAALTQLADLYSSQGLSLKSDELRTRSSVIKQRALDCDIASSRSSGDVENQAVPLIIASNDPDVSPADGKMEDSTKATSNNSAANDSSDDDWEALADREPSKLLSVEELPEISKLSVEEPKAQGPKRRGRGTFTYNRDAMYSDRDFCESRFDDSDDNDMPHGSEKSDESLKSKYGTRHVLVLADFSPSLRTTDLEKLFKDFKDSGFIIRWVNDTTALAVFKTPSAALEACNRVQCSFTIRILDDHNSLLGSISGKDLEPPSQRPKTSARTARRLIAHSMGLKLPASGFGSKELRDQEAARKNRIVSRQKQREDAWGDD